MKDGGRNALQKDLENWLRQVGRVLKPRAYKFRILFFVALSGASCLISWVIAPPDVSDIFLEFAVTFAAVGLLQLVWDLLGGEPMELRIDELEQEVKRVQSSVATLPSITEDIDGMKDKMLDIQSSLEVLVHLKDTKVGIERVWKNRGKWQRAPHRVTEWHERVCKAKKVDIVSNTFWSNWMSDRKFRQELFEHAKSGDCERIRILIYEPGSKIQQSRAKVEPGDPDQMKKEIEFTLDELKRGRKAFGLSAGGKLQVGITRSLLHPAQIIRADDRMLVSTYLIGEGGSTSPTMQIRGTKSAFFKTYKKQFKTQWEQAEIVDAKQLAQILK